MTIPLVERLRNACLDIETGEPLDDDARPDLYVSDLRAILEALTAPAEGVTLETTAEERADVLSPHKIFQSQFPEWCRRAVRDIATLTAALAAEMRGPRLSVS